jgi:signal transduction histidine kinase
MLIAILVVLLGLDSLVLYVTWDPADWHPAGLVLVLVGFAVVSEVGAVGFRGLFVSSSFLAIILAAAALGPGPAAAVGLSTVIVDVLVRRHRLTPLLANTAIFLTYPLVCAIAIDLLRPPEGESRAGVAFVVLAVGVASGFVNFAIVAGIRRLNPGFSFLDAVRDVYWPTVPYQIVGASLSVVAVHANETYGLSLTAVVVTVCLVSELLLRSVTAAHIRADDVLRLNRQRAQLLEEALRVEEAERARLAQHLHDETLQLLAGAEQDIADGDPDRAAAQIAAAVAELRRTLVHLHPVSVAMHGLGTALKAYAEQLSRRANVPIVVTVEESSRAESDVLLYSIGRELLRNAARHARASLIELTVSTSADARVLRVVDDGTGFDESADPGHGHVGLASARQRVGAAGGKLTFHRAEGAGTTAVVRVPLRESVVAVTGRSLGPAG